MAPARRTQLCRRPAAARTARSKRVAHPVVPHLRPDATFEAFLELYSRYQAVLIRGCLQANSAVQIGRSGVVRRRRRAVGMATLRKVYSEHPKIVERTFCLESAKGAKDDVASTSAETVLGTRKVAEGKWYASFVVQKSRAAVADFLQELPFEVPPFLYRPATRGFKPVEHSKAVWVFFGQNAASTPLQGRPEHTDAIAHSGTWHLQLHGAKVWTLRPTAELAKSCQQLRRVRHTRIRCEQGDVLCVNTRLWWHQTQLPGKCKLSMSVARDMWLDRCRAGACDMTNIEGHYAKRSIERGVVIFTEEDAPNLELPRSQQANCELRELGDGRLAVVAKRRIAAGDWLALSDSESEEEQQSRPQKRQRR